MSKQILFSAAGLIAIVLVVGSASAQLQPQAGAANNCVLQYEDAGASLAGVVSQGYSVVAAFVNGVWLQKDKTLVYCNSGKPREGEVICWRVREPLKGQPCT